ncbi:hypothetical protein D1631_07770 [Chryseobacterium nematophagum]|uniref:Glycosyltransferase RgtA/B/C/D-like domain-containing protein n=1 Tax=Chryseobacterium nematophagum TaxID=2305228 RepID=A0A3M7TG03_9FLAO|nr:hypothetical protein D1631_07770 [Chryseobacterium nematophagum]
MKEKSSHIYLTFLNILIVIYSCYIGFTIFINKVLLADDLSKVYESKNISEPYFKYIHTFLDTYTMASRPISGFVTGTLVFFSKYNENVYFLGLLFFPLSLISIYIVIQKILSKELASLITLLYLCSLLGTSIQFSPIMLNSNLATIFFSLSIFYLYFHEKILISSLFFIASVLSYEIFFPLFLLHVFLLKDNRKRILFLVLTLGVIIVFRKVIQPIVFVHSYQRDDISKILDFNRVVFVGICSVKLFFKDIFVGIYKSLLNIKRLYFLELVLALLISLTIYQTFRHYNFRHKLQFLEKICMISFISTLVGLSVFTFSSYIPTVFGFDNRNLGAVRLFYTIFVSTGLIYLFIKIKLRNQTISIVLASIIFILITTNINIKNSWIYAHNYNNELFSKLKLALKKDHITEGVVCIDNDIFNELSTNSNLIFKESIFYNNWESPMLCEMNGLDSRKIHVYNREKNRDCSTIFLYKNGLITRVK